MEQTSKKGVRKPAGRAADKASAGFSAEEKAAMKAYAKELKAQARADRTREDGEREVLAAIAAMPEADRVLAARVHALVKAHAPALVPKTWYGMPAYALDDKVVCFFKDAQKFKDRYATLGFNDKARLDDGAMWPTAFALKTMNAEVEKRIAALLKKALG
ncbi:iron chaperone [Rhodanobacter sp. Si-c]|uniref:Iron chaperone n=1 Tax=Rhodanobacter lycopersici TaxID=3162487 RepID=A0ABV3QGM4_9GAMM